MELEVIEGKCEINDTGVDDEVMGCSSFMYGCCIIHFWCWDAGTGACC